jgi:RNA polymerase sigma-70 factor (ECF subfamily)
MGTGCRRSVYEGHVAGTGPSVEGGALIERARHGDHRAYAQVVRDHQEVAFRTAYFITRSATDAEDVTQEAFLKAWRGLGRFRPDAPFRPWLLRIVANEARNRMRSNRRRHEVPEPPARDARPASLGGSPLEPADPAASPEELALAADQRRMLLDALERLREEDRLVIGSRYFLELSEAEMADALGVARGTIKSRLSRAMARLRAELEGIG